MTSIGPHVRPTARALLALALGITAAGCERADESAARDAAPAVAHAEVGAARAGEPARARLARVESPELEQLRRHLDFGEIEAARGLLSAAPSAGSEEPQLRARFLALRGEVLAALRLLEDAQKAAPCDPGTYATAAEIYAQAGKPDSAWEKVRAGESACGSAPELTRAKGLVWLLREGGTARGLALLEEARAADHELPFVDRALAQAHLLAGKAAARAEKPLDALAHARRAVELDSGEIDAQRFLADALASVRDYDGAIAILAALVARGESLSAELASLEKRAGMAALLARDRDTALIRFAAARAHGLTDAELGTGARLLVEASRERVDMGVAAYERGELDEALACFRTALRFDPDSLQAHNHLAVAAFQRGAFAEAIEHWQRVLERAAAEELALPEPVHLNLAKAQFQSGDAAAARATLAAYLERDPQGAWVDGTRAMLALIPPP